MEKVKIQGEDASPLWKYIIGEMTNFSVNLNVTKHAKAYCIKK